MPAGFQTFTDGGLLQIDGAWRNLHLVHAGNGVLGTSSMDAFHAAQARCSQFALAAWVFSGSVGGFPLTGEYVNGIRKSIIMRDGSPNQNAQWYLFDYTPSRSLSNYGLEVFTEAGELAYSSTDYALRILDYFEFFPSANNPNGEDEVAYTNRTGKPVAYMPTRSNFYYDYDGQNIEIGDAFMRTVGNQLIVNSGYSMMESAGMGWQRTDQAALFSLVVDLTGFPTNYSR